MSDLAALRKPFRPEQVGKLPKAGLQLDYVGHAAVTDRLLDVDPEWSWEPFAVDADGGPLIHYGNRDAVLWGRLTVLGVTRPGVGIVPVAAGDLEKQLISDFIRNAAMRFGVALDLWSKEDLHPYEPPPPDPIASGEDLAALEGRVDALTDAGRQLFRERWKNLHSLQGHKLALLPDRLVELVDETLRGVEAADRTPREAPQTPEKAPEPAPAPSDSPAAPLTQDERIAEIIEEVRVMKLVEVAGLVTAAGLDVNEAKPAEHRKWLALHYIGVEFPELLPSLAPSETTD